MPSPKTITIPGRGEFKSYSAAGRALGVTAQAIRDAERKNRLDKIGVKPDFSIVYKGEKYDSINAAAKKSGDSYRQIWCDQLAKRGGTVRTPIRQTQFHVLNRTWLSLSELGRFLGVKYNCVRNAYRENKLQHYLETRCVYNGREYFSIHEAAQANNRSWRYVEKRIQQSDNS